MSSEKNEVFESEIDWQSLDLVIRGWIALSGFENDQKNYSELASLYNFKHI